MVSPVYFRELSLQVRGDMQCGVSWLHVLYRMEWMLRRRDEGWDGRGKDGERGDGMGKEECLGSDVAGSVSGGAPDPRRAGSRCRVVCAGSSG